MKVIKFLVLVGICLMMSAAPTFGVDKAPNKDVVALESLGMYIAPGFKIPEVDLDELSEDQTTNQLESLKESPADTLDELFAAFYITEHREQIMAAKLLQP